MLWTETRQLWEIMLAAVHKKNRDFSLQYFVGFSHALMLVGCIDGAEWLKVKNLRDSHGYSDE